MTSRPFSRCPAAQTRTASPAIATTPPMTSDRRVGCASHNAMPAEMNPIATRRRAIPRAISATNAPQPEPVLDGGGHFRHSHAPEAPLAFVGTCPL